MDYVMSPTAPAGNLTTGCSSAAKKLFSPFSPMDTHPQKICESTTPRRRLSLGMDENAQSPFRKTDTDQGYSGSSCSSLESSLNGGGGEGSGGSTGEKRHPLSEIKASVWNTMPSSGGGGVAKSLSSAHRRTLLARRSRKKISLADDPTHSGKTDLTGSLNLSRPLTLLDRPSSLPTLPLSPLSQQSTNQTLFQQINSPLERMNLASPSPHHPHHPPRSTSLTSSTTTEASDGYFSEVFDGDEMEGSADAPLSDNVSSLISAPVINPPATSFINKPQFFIGGPKAASAGGRGIPCPTPTRPGLFQRSDSWSQPPANKRPPLKRASPCSEVSQLHLCKRPPLPVFATGSHSNSSPPRNKTPKGVPLLRSQSLCMPPVAGGGGESPSSSSPEGMDRIGDFSKPYALPLVKGGIADLKSISPDTFAQLIQGKYSSVIDDFKIIDCRFPYEFEGGHVRGAVNIWNKFSLLEEFLANPHHSSSGKRTVYIFHCEFSSQRGPQMSRYLREKDRKKNGMDFPKLYYPELYLLHGGYKTFFEQHPELCDPKSYLAMLDKAHKDDLKLFKQRSKSWNGGDSHSRVQRQHNLRTRRSTVYDSASASASTRSSPVKSKGGLK